MTIDDYLNIEPMTLLLFFKKQTEFEIPATLDTPEEKQQAADQLQKALSWYEHYKELETCARIKKREMKSKDKELSDHYLGTEEVCKTFKEICEKNIDIISKMMTIKRLELDEIKLQV